MFLNGPRPLHWPLFDASKADKRFDEESLLLWLSCHFPSSPCTCTMGERRVSVCAVVLVAKIPSLLENSTTLLY